MASRGYGTPGHDEEELVFSQSRGRSQHGPVYSRTWSKAREDLESSLMRLYGLDSNTNHALILPSGMGAIGAVMSSVAASCSGQEWTLVYGDELYCDVARTVQYVAEASGGKITTCPVEIRDTQRLRRLFTEKGAGIRLFHFEACTNPSGQIFDFTLLKELRALAPQCVFVCDNTWLSGALFNPFEHGADIVLESMTKYVSAGRCIGGFVVGASSLIAPVLSWITVFGVFVGADHCQIFLQGLQTISKRMATISATAEAIAVHLEAHPAVNRVMYPTLASHPTHGLAQRYLTRGGPGCIWFHVGAAKKAVVSVLTRGAACPEFKTSFGAADSRVDPWPKSALSNACEWPRGGAQGLQGTWLRLAVGHVETMQETQAAVDTLLAQLCPGVDVAAEPVAKAQVSPQTEAAASMRWKRRA
ncbi:metC [Symbiodinium pilosum]|uniref:MetC protein n=1 Tax=Symbiodinium pilosum TaxID=2952 RepID=A0A812MJA4_SYMPI|nr:metC [Symbiodinium pilosum]